MEKAILILSLFLSLFLGLQAQQSGSFKINGDNEFIQIGYDNNYRVLTLGGDSGSPNGIWGMEHWDGGLNIFKPWPGWQSGNYDLYISDHDQNVGISRKPYYKLDVNGHVRSWNGILTGSDERMKTNISSLAGAKCLELISQTKAYTYNMLKELPISYDNVDMEGVSEAKRKTMEADMARKSEYDERTKMGFMAQELEQVMPELVYKDGEGVYSVDYVSMVPVLTEAIKEQQRMIIGLQDKVAELERQIQGQGK